MKIIYFHKGDINKSYITKNLVGHEVTFVEGTLQDTSISDVEADIVCVFIMSRVGSEEFDRFPKTKLFATRSTGFDHIDVAEAEKRGVTVVNVPTYGENTVAEHAFALLLTLSRKIYDAYEQVREDGSFAQDTLRGFDLAGKTMGIIGTGNIGKHSVRMAYGFDMQILGFDLHQDKELTKKFGIKYVSMEELISQSDVINLHVPYNKHTHHLLNSENMQNLKKGSYLINTARGAVVETEAMIKALQDGRLAGAGLDVLEEEGVLMSDDETALLFDDHPNAEKLKKTLENHFLIDHPRVIITPHVAFNTDEAVQRILDTTLENIRSFASGKPQNVVKPR